MGLNLDTNTKLIILGVLVLLVVLIVIILIINARKNKIKQAFDEVNVRLNEVKTVPLAFKLNKAQAMARRSEETSAAVKEYYAKYEKAQKHIDEMSELLLNAEDAIGNKDYKEAKTIIDTLNEKLDSSEAEVRNIDKFLEQFQEKETEQRRFSAHLKESYREVKMFINENEQALSIAYNGFINKLAKCEDLFSNSEEWMYANDLIKAQEDLNKIELILKDIKDNVMLIPELAKYNKGIIPSLLDEAVRRYELTRQRGLQLGDLNIDTRIGEIRKAMNDNVKFLMEGETQGIKDHSLKLKAELEKIIDDLANEESNSQEVKIISEKIGNDIADIKKMENYVRVAYVKDKTRYDLKDINKALNDIAGNIGEYQSIYLALNNDMVNNARSATKLLEEFKELANKAEKDKEQVTEYKNIIDKNTNDEIRARNQLIKFQIVLNEIEVKVKEYRLPAIAESYETDLAECKKRIEEIEKLLKEIPINLENLNETLDEAIDYIHEFYNNVNNIVGMAIMVENAIVFGNRFRSSYEEVDGELSKAEFSYINGEYTRALTLVINCLEKILPNKVDETILENV